MVPAKRQHDRLSRCRVGNDAAFKTEDLSHIVFRQHVLWVTEGVQAPRQHGQKIVKRVILSPLIARSLSVFCIAIKAPAGALS